MSKAVKICLSAVVVIVVAAAAGLLLLDVNQFRGVIQSQLEASLGRKVSLGDMGLSLFPLAIRASQVSIAEDPAFSTTTPFLTASQISVRVGLMPLLKKEIRVDSVRVLQPVVELIKNREGRWNFSTLGQTGASAAAADTGAAQGLALSDLRLENGRIGLTNQEDAKPRVQYDNIDISLKAYAPGKPFSLELAVRLPENLSAQASISALHDGNSGRLDMSSIQAKLGGLTLSGSGHLLTKADPPALDCKLSTKQASITELAQAAAAFGQAFSKEMKVTGNLNADLHLTGPAGNPQATGEIALHKVEMSRSGWKQPVRVPNATLQLTPTAIRSNTFAVESGNTRLNASMTVEDYTGKPWLNATLSTHQANLQELLHMAEAYGVSAAKDVAATGIINLDVKLAGPFANLDYSGSGSLENATLQLPSLNKPIQIRSTNLRFDEGRAVLDNLNASLGSSNLQGTLKLRNFSSPEFEFNANINQLNIAELQQLASTAPAAPANKGEAPASPLRRMRGSGTLAAGKIQYSAFTLSNVRAQAALDKGVLRLDPVSADLFGGQQKGIISADMRGEDSAYGVQSRFERVNANELVSAATNLKNLLYGAMAAETNLQFSPKPGTDFARALNGTFQFQLNNGKLSGISILNEMAKIGKFLGYSPKSELVTNILALAGTFQLRDGVASTSDLRLDYDGGSLAAQGDIGLLDSSLKMKLTSILAKQISDQAGGSQIGGYLTTALANSKGELIIPCLVSGTTAKPVFVPDAAEFARLKVQNLANPAGITSGIRGIIEGGRKDGGKGVGGALLDIFGGRKKAAETKKEP